MTMTMTAGAMGSTSSTGTTTRAQWLDYLRTPLIGAAATARAGAGSPDEADGADGRPRPAEASAPPHG